ncbi:ubiquitin-like protein Pup [Blastococcus sp. PRF04-17]|uniref:ubiquitin-like protein Pup n=1 Tax=Blastococcus sp. PRF04-17 TaxID=2933797 RepID=UPI001FF61150|nr:ubiquitin-like protein Pup [Blastococcus sp. PRF04-17]
MATRDTGGQQKATRSREETDEVEASVDTEVAERHKEMTEDVDSLLDEIDEVLEENSEEFVRQYVQKGGVELPSSVTIALRKWNPRSSARTAGSRAPSRPSPETSADVTAWRSTVASIRVKGCGSRRRGATGRLKPATS